jgi:hypothetical protein
MDVVTLLLLLAAAVCFTLAAFGVSARVNFIALGLLFWVLVPLLGAALAVG